MSWPTTARELGDNGKVFRDCSPVDLDINLGLLLKVHYLTTSIRPEIASKVHYRHLFFFSFEKFRLCPIPVRHSDRCRILHIQISHRDPETPEYAPRFGGFGTGNQSPMGASRWLGFLILAVLFCVGQAQAADSTSTESVSVPDCGVSLDPYLPSGMPKLF